VAIFQDVETASDRSLTDTMNAYYPQAKNRLLKVKAFVDFLTARFGHSPMIMTPAKEPRGR
jgi:hypothetical protein